MADSSAFLSVSQFAAREGVSRPRVLQWLAAQRIPGALRVGHLWSLPAGATVTRLAAGRPVAGESASQQRLLAGLARKYLWWLAPGDASKWPDRVILQVMDMGDYEDVRGLATALGARRLVRALLDAEAGQLSDRSWNYWHHRLRQAKGGRVPAPPRRVFSG